MMRKKSVIPGRKRNLRMMKIIWPQKPTLKYLSRESNEAQLTEP